MPIYEYQCKRCKSLYVRYQNKPDGGLSGVKCVVCGEKAQKILSTVNHSGKKKGKP